MFSLSVRKVHHRYISQYLKFQGILKFLGCQLVASSMFYFRAMHRVEQPTGAVTNVECSNINTVRWEITNYARV